ncbi:hypothetical protein [Pararobbsia silviterrae]|uniref:hypothetical protein n=1 Tax=Pararobbsia silviterrae TaxID=1792498 RepID=UPI0011C3D976|nr:hypothetical protein [Pararobbsia silviterrae]
MQKIAIAPGAAPMPSNPFRIESHVDAADLDPLGSRFDIAIHIGFKPRKAWPYCMGIAAPQTKFLDDRYGA